MQLDFLWNEMQNYTTMMTELKNARKIKDASDSFLFRFERPANQGSSVQLARASYATEYFNKFGSATAKQEEKKPSKLYKVQVGAFRDKTNADKRVSYLSTIGIKAIIKTAGSYYKVQAGAFSSKTNAEVLLMKVKNAGFEDAYITYE